MRKLKKYLTLTGCMILTVLLAACGQKKVQESTPETEGKRIEVEERATESELVDIEEEETAYYFVTLDGVNFTRYVYEGEEDATPRKLLVALAKKTGWKLGLIPEITDGKGGLSVGFKKDSCIYQPVPEKQKEGFEVADQERMVAAILGSIQKTLQYYAAPTDPDKVDIYFYGEDDAPLEIEGILNLPLEQPYSYEYWHEDGQ